MLHHLIKQNPPKLTLDFQKIVWLSLYTRLLFLTVPWYLIPSKSLAWVGGCHFFVVILYSIIFPFKDQSVGQEIIFCCSVVCVVWGELRNQQMSWPQFLLSWCRQRWEYIEIKYQRFLLERIHQPSWYQYCHHSYYMCIKHPIHCKWFLWTGFLRRTIMGMTIVYFLRNFIFA